ncbi:MAG: TIGR02266 family protein [Myxococcota bacterium]|nr:TIGR02266 family protein [Myxococcota bacterium]
MSENRRHQRAPLRMQLNYRDATGGNFLIEHATNISRGGIFIETEHPLPIGAQLAIQFQAEGSEEPIQVEGEVMWVNAWKEGGENPNPGMGIRFTNLSDSDRATIASIVKSIAILPE